MSMLDIFNSDAFSLTTLTDAILKAPYKPGRLGELGLFTSEGISTTSAVIEEQDGQLSLIESTPRGGPGSHLGESKRTARSFTVPHFQRESTIMADSLQGVRAFGTENSAPAIEAVRNARLATLRQMHEVTLEYLRMGALKGQVIDGDGSTVLLDLFTAFGVSQQTYAVDTTETTWDARQQFVQIQRLSEAELGAELVSGYRAFCGANFFDRVMEMASVKESLKYQESATLRVDLRKGFTFAGITFEEYRGRVGSVDFIDTDEAYVAPEGTSLFQTRFAPADFMETVNTLGLPIYTKAAIDQEFQRWIKLHSQMNPLCYCRRPRAVIKLTYTT